MSEYFTARRKKLLVYKNEFEDWQQLQYRRENTPLWSNFKKKKKRRRKDRE